VTKVTLEDDNRRQRKALELTREVNQFKSEQGIELERVYNTDQSGFNYEMTSARTLRSEVRETLEVLFNQ